MFQMTSVWHPQRLLQLAVRNESIVSIVDVENGLKCNCVCPVCGQALVAKNNLNNIKEAHFAHYRSIECATAVETAIHKLAKQILLEGKEIRLPAYNVAFDGSSIEIIPEQTMTFDDVLIEKMVHCQDSFVIADGIGKYKGRELMIEFAYSHFIDVEKKEKIKKSKQACIEIDLRGVEQTFDSVRDRLIGGCEKTKWINNLNAEKKGEKMLLELRQRKLQAIQKEHREQAEAKKRELREQAELERAINAPFDPYKKKGYLVIAKTEYGVLCPVKSLILSGFTSTDYGKTDLVRRILIGQRWDGQVYGSFPAPLYIYLNDVKFDLTPGPWVNLSKKQRAMSAFYFISLKRYAALANALSSSPCAYCPFFIKEINEKVICSVKLKEVREGPPFFRYSELYNSDLDLDLEEVPASMIGNKEEYKETIEEIREEVRSIFNDHP